LRASTKGKECCRGCPIGVISGHFASQWLIPLYPRKRTATQKRMSALGHKRTYATQKGMSALPNSDREIGFAKTVPLYFWKRTCAARTRRQFGPDRTILRKNFAKDNDQTREDRP
jgi:hypothetical protein